MTYEELQEKALKTKVLADRLKLLTELRCITLNLRKSDGDYVGGEISTEIIRLGLDIYTSKTQIELEDMLK